MFRWVFTVFIALVVLSAAMPWLAKLGIGRLPGDFRLTFRGKTYVFPFASTILLSLILMLLMRLL